MAQSKGNGAGVGDFVTGTLIQKHNIKLIKVDVGADLRSQDDASREAVERALQFIQPLAFFAVDDSSGVIHCVVDGSQFDATSLQAQIRAIGNLTTDADVDNAPTAYDFRNAVVTEGTDFTVS